MISSENVVPTFKLLHAQAVDKVPYPTFSFGTPIDHSGEQPGHGQENAQVVYCPVQAYSREGRMGRMQQWVYVYYRTS